MQSEIMKTPRTAERCDSSLWRPCDLMSPFSLSVLLSLQAPPEHQNLLQPATLTFTNDSSPC